MKRIIALTISLLIGANKDLYTGGDLRFKLAVQFNEPATVTYILSSKKPDPNSSLFFNNLPPLHFAIHTFKPEMVKALAEWSETNINQTADRLTPLQRALQQFFETDSKDEKNISSILQIIKVLKNSHYFSMQLIGAVMEYKDSTADIEKLDTVINEINEINTRDHEEGVRKYLSLNLTFNANLLQKLHKLHGPVSQIPLPSFLTATIWPRISPPSKKQAVRAAKQQLNGSPKKSPWKP